MKKITFIVIVAGLSFYFAQSFFNSKSSNPHDHDSHEHKEDHITDNSSTSTSTSTVKKETTATGPKKTSNHAAHDHGNSDEGFEVEKVEIPRNTAGQSLIEMGEITSSFAHKNIDIDALKSSLTKSGLEVVSTKDSNPYTGSMTVIRTNNSLPGTRYFHAQIFTDEGGNPFVQHMSYEYRPSEKAFAEVVAATKKTFGLTKVADVRKDGFYSWNTDDGYIIWIKRMAKEDLKDDPFNAYTDADIGTIRVAKEIEIH